MNIVKLVTAVVCAGILCAPTASAQGAGSASTSTDSGSSLIDTAAVVSSGSSLSSDTSLSSIPALISGELAEGEWGSALFGGLPSVTGSALSSGPGSSNTELTLPDPELGDVRLVDTRHVTGDQYEFDVYSSAMDRIITNDILLPGGPDNTSPRPTFYLMMGADGAAGGSAWAESTNYEEFFADKNVNVVTPIGSISSMQTDWYYEDQATGTNRWATYMTYELPHIVDTYFYGSGRDAIAGISMSGGPALNLAAHSPERFKAAGSYSGCPSTLGIGGYLFTTQAVEMNGGSATNMWGLPGNEAWAANSPALNVDKLRDTAVFISAAHGIPGPIDGLEGSSRLRPISKIEIASFACSTYFVDQADQAGVDVDWYPMTEGHHWWGMFEHQMRTSWRTIGPALGVE